MLCGYIQSTAVSTTSETKRGRAKPIYFLPIVAVTNTASPPNTAKRPVRDKRKTSGKAFIANAANPGPPSAGRKSSGLLDAKTRPFSISNTSSSTVLIVANSSGTAVSTLVTGSGAGFGSCGAGGGPSGRLLSVCIAGVISRPTNITTIVV